MISKQQEYLSSNFKNTGFAFLAPFGSILFQWIVFQKASFVNFVFSIISLVIGFGLLWVGYNFLEDEKIMLDTSNPDVMGPLMFFIFVAGTFITLGAMDYDFKKNKKNHSAV